jgi:CRISPR/Cas system CSM-associated protein Csm2 small subunit
VAVEIYALQPRGDQSTSLLMASEMKQLHAKVYNELNGIDGAALRDSTVLLDDVGGKPCDETRRLPLLDTTSFKMYQVTVRHILDYVFYKEGGRSHTAGMTFVDTIFDDAESKAINMAATASRPVEASSGIEVVLSDALSDSDDDDDDQVIEVPRHVSGEEGPPEPNLNRDWSHPVDQPTTCFKRPWKCRTPTWRGCGSTYLT